MPEPPGVLAGRYRVLETLGSGGVGTVYACWDQVLETEWAVKEVVLPSGGDPAAHARLFQDEARLLARLRHPGLPRVVDFFEQDDRCYLVMDRVRGCTLREWLEARPGPLGATRALDWLTGILDVVVHLHEQAPPVIVRDITPSNVMVDDDGHLRLIDFGLARAMAPDARTSPLLEGWGSPGFAAPEQYGPGGTDVRTDLYAVGAIAWRMLTGGNPPEAVGRLVGGGGLPSLDGLEPPLPEGLEAWMRRALALRADDRFQDARTMRAALLGIRAGGASAGEPGRAGASGSSAGPGASAGEPGRAGASGSSAEPGASPGREAWEGFAQRLALRLAPHGWGRSADVPEPYEAGFARPLGLRRLECWMRPATLLTEDDMEAACAHARSVALRALGLLPSTLFVIVAAERIPNPVAVQAVAAAGQVAGYRSVVFIPVDLERRVALDGHVGPRFSDTNNLSDFVLNLRIALASGAAGTGGAGASSSRRSRP